MLLNDFEPTVICKASKMAQSLENNPNPSINLVIAGHVDHGKSTLIGRLLHDTDSLTEGKMAAVKAMSERRGMPLEYAFLLDALQAERDQGITIDTTQVLFNSKKRSYLIIDAPGLNKSASELFKKLGFESVSETFRMYRGFQPPVSMNDVYGLACLELG